MDNSNGQDVVQVIHPFYPVAELRVGSFTLYFVLRVFDAH